MATDDGWPVYTLRRSASKRRGGETFSITVPPEIGRVLPRGSRFAFSLTDEGFAYALVREAAGLPGWVTELAPEVEG